MQEIDTSEALMFAQQKIKIDRSAGTRDKAPGPRIDKTQTSHRIALHLVVSHEHS